ncbi:MAG: hypothetical protein EA412_02600 [Chitinophagaceae bacterium]|nr:MAG: hypothetical protein EA412_02600 [Chitinophagaceae bacterium]
MRKIRLNILSLNQSVTQNQSFAVILSETDGNRRLPIVIGAFEAQAIALIMENVKIMRPMTHDLMKNVIVQLGGTLEEVRISNLSEGVFFAELVLKKNGELFTIDSRTSDAIAMAIRFDCPVYTYETILEMGGITVDEPEEKEEKKKEKEPPKEEKAKPKSTSSKKTQDLTSFALPELQKLLTKALENEDYEQAAGIRDEISKREKS